MIILLTASIDPPAYKLFSSSERERQYIEALKYYLFDLPEAYRVVFVENSGWPLDNIKKELGQALRENRIEFIQFKLDYLTGMRFAVRKAYGELGCLDEALKRSLFISDEPGCHIAKITGRLLVKNMRSLFHSLPDEFSFACDIKDQGWFFRRLLGSKLAAPYYDTRFFVFSPWFYERYFKSIYEKVVKESLNLERAVYEIVNAIDPKEVKIIKRFALEPDFSGYSGSFKMLDFDSVRNRKMKFIRNLIRKAAPWVHL